MLENISTASHLKSTVAMAAACNAPGNEKRPYLAAVASYSRRQIKTIPPFVGFLDFGRKLNSVGS